MIDEMRQLKDIVMPYTKNKIQTKLTFCTIMYDKTLNVRMNPCPAEGTSWHVYSVNIQISLRIRTVGTEF